MGLQSTLAMQTPRYYAHSIITGRNLSPHKEELIENYPATSITDFVHNRC